MQNLQKEYKKLCEEKSLINDQQSVIEDKMKILQNKYNEFIAGECLVCGTPLSSTFDNYC